MKRFRFYLQHDSMDCGPACLRMVARYYGLKTDQSAIKNLSGMTNTGLSLLGLNITAEKLGFSTQAAKLEIGELEQAPLPAILHWNQQHYVVLYRVARGQFYIADPAAGKMVLDRTSFIRHWADGDAETCEGTALLLEPAGDFKPGKFADENTGKNETGGKKKLLEYLFRHRSQSLWLLLLLTAGAAVQLIPSYLTKNIVDRAITRADLSFLALLLIAQFCLLVGRIGLEYGRGKLLLFLSTRINISIGSDFISKLLKLPLPFFNTQTKGNILQRMQDHSRIESFLTGAVLNIVFAVISLVIFLVILFVSDLSIFLIFLGSTTLYVCWVFYFMQRRKKLDYERFELTVKENNVTLKILEGMQEIRLFGIEESVKEDWHHIREKNYGMNLKLFRLSQLQQGGGLLINETRNIIILFFLAGMVISGQVSLGTMMAIQLIIGQLSAPVEQLVTFSQSWQQAGISMDRINEIHGTADEEEMQPGRKADERDTLIHEKTIRFRDVSFAYPGAGNERVLDQVCCTIPVGKTTAIVGSSGSGKTTLLKLLLKYYSPGDGSITINGLDLDHYRHRSWRMKCGVVMQDSFIFPDTIARNIAPGNQEIDRDRLAEAIRIARIGDLVNQLPAGVETKIGSEGQGISSGQRQRILIARVIYKNPDFIFLDEATNNLDTFNEKLIHEELRNFFRNKTVIIVAHRLSTIRSADQILVLKQGKISESGNHDELTKINGEYLGLIRNQLHQESSIPS